MDKAVRGVWVQLPFHKKNVPNAGIELLHEVVESQAAVIAQRGQCLDKQTAIKLRASKEHAGLRGELAQRAVRM